MAVVDGFWVADLEGTADRMNACLTLIGTVAEIGALSAATYKRCLAFATDTGRLYYSTGSAWVSMENATQAEVLAVAQAQPTRVLDTVYQNTSGKPIFLTICVDTVGTEAAGFYCDTNPSPSTLIGTMYSTVASEMATVGSFVVPPGYYYKLNADTGTPTVVKWTEWTLH